MNGIKREKVIKGLEWCMCEKHDCYREKGCPYENESDDVGCKYALHRDALALLKAQEPTKPKLGGNAGPFGTQWYQCGACSGQIDPGDKYCRTCGREVEWK